MEKVCLIRPPYAVYNDTLSTNLSVPALSLACLAGTLKAKKHFISFVDAPGERLGSYQNDPEFDFLLLGLNAVEIVEKIPIDTNIIGVTCMFSTDWLYTLKVLRLIREKFPSILIILGGEHITADTQMVCSKIPEGSICTIGEGEETFLELVEAHANGKNIFKIPGIAYRDDQGLMIKTPPRDRIRNLDSLPPPYWEGLYLENYLNLGYGNQIMGKRSVPIVASRGCPYQCTFCTSPNMWGTKWIIRSPELVVQEMISLISRYQVNHFDFFDLTAIVNAKWTIEFCKLIVSKNLNITWSLPSGTRSEALTPEVLMWMKKAGVNRIQYAPETGSERMSEIIGKRVKLNKMLKSMRAAVNEDINVRATIIIGLPGSYLKDIFKDFIFITKMIFIGVHDIACYNYTPYPGSQLFKDLLKKGRIPINQSNEDFSYEKFLAKSSFNSLKNVKSYCDSIPNWAIPLLCTTLMAYFYAFQFLLRPNRLIIILKKVIAGKVLDSSLEIMLVVMYDNWIRGKKNIKSENS